MCVRKMRKLMLFIEQSLINVRQLVGQTKRRLNIRVNEHMKKCANKDRGTAIYTHMKGSNHKFNFNNVKVLHTEQSLGKRKLAEMLFIHARKQYINNQQDTKTLRFEYKTFIKKTNSYNSICYNSTITLIVQYQESMYVKR